MGRFGRQGRSGCTFHCGNLKHTPYLWDVPYFCLPLTEEGLQSLVPFLHKQWMLQSDSDKHDYVLAYMPCVYFSKPACTTIIWSSILTQT